LTPWPDRSPHTSGAPPTSGPRPTRPPDAGPPPRTLQPLHPHPSPAPVLCTSRCLAQQQHGSVGGTICTELLSALLQFFHAARPIAAGDPGVDIGWENAPQFLKPRSVQSLPPLIDLPQSLRPESNFIPPVPIQTKNFRRNFNVLLLGNVAITLQRIGFTKNRYHSFEDAACQILRLQRMSATRSGPRDHGLPCSTAVSSIQPIRP
jgi:hypothetical protein